MIFKLTWRNLWRNRRRTLITMTSVTFAVLLAILMQSFQKGVFDNLVKNVVSFYYGYIQLHKYGYQDEQVLDNGFLFSDSLEKKLNNYSQIKTFVPRLETFILASSGDITKGCMLAGTDPEKEDILTGIKTKITYGSYINNDDDDIVIAAGLAERLNLHVNDTIVLLGQGYHGTLAAGKYKIKGVAKFGSPQLNDALLFLPLAQAQSFLNAEGLLTSISLAIDNPTDMESIQKDVIAMTGIDYEVLNWKQMMPEIDNHIKADSFSAYIFNGILYLIIAFGIFGTILMMTTERRYEFGMFIAIGMKKSKLGKMLLGETIMITALGVTVGLLLSLPIVLYFNQNPIQLTGRTAVIYERFGFEALFPTALYPPIFLNQAIIVLIIALLIGFYPLWHIAKIDPVKAMKK